MIKDLQTRLIAYYDAYGRDLPWRLNKDPYRIWVSEIMLQQTQVKTVIPYYEGFLKRLPTVSDLASIDETELMKLWEGLGYYSRVKNMQKAAKMICSDWNKEIPKDVEGLLSLPGIGVYTAGAIASMAYDLKVPAIDGNVIRVISRYFGKPYSKMEIQQLMPSLLPNHRVGDFNQAIMDVGSGICLPVAKPLCETCPLQKQCIAHQLNLTDKIPEKIIKPKRVIEEKTLVIVSSTGLYAIRKRPVTGLLSGLWEFPMFDGNLDESTSRLLLSRNGLEVDLIEPLPKIKHVFTHKEWVIHCFKAPLKEPLIPHPLWTFATKAELLDTYALSSLYKPLLEDLS